MRRLLADTHGGKIFRSDVAADAHGRKWPLLPCRPPSSTRPLMKEEETYDRGLASHQLGLFLGGHGPSRASGDAKSSFGWAVIRDELKSLGWTNGRNACRAPQECAGTRFLNSAAWSFTKSCMFVGASPVSLRMVFVMRS